MSKKISELPVAAALTGTELLPTVQGGVTSKTTAQDIANLANGGVLSVTGSGVNNTDPQNPVISEGNFIPLAGTAVGSPVTGDIEFSNDYKRIYTTYGNDEVAALELGDDNSIALSLKDGANTPLAKIAFSRTSLNMQVSSPEGETQYGSGISFSPLGLNVNLSDPDAVGIHGGVDYTANITDLDYTQKKYVDAQRPYKVYTVIMNQGVTNAPTVSELENTIGAIVWTYQGVGEYIGTLTGAFPADLTFSLNDKTGWFDNLESNNAAYMELVRFNDNSVILTTYNQLGASANSRLSGKNIEIRVYLP